MEAQRRLGLTPISTSYIFLERIVFAVYLSYLSTNITYFKFQIFQIYFTDHFLLKYKVVEKRTLWSDKISLCSSPRSLLIHKVPPFYISAIVTKLCQSMVQSKGPHKRILRNMILFNQQPLVKVWDQFK